MLLAKSTSNHTEVFISKSLIDLNISHDEFVYNVPKEYDKMKRNKKFKDLISLLKILVSL